MPFPKMKIHFNKSFGSCPRENTIEDENGNITTKIENCNKTLPPSEYFEINNQIAAGVTLNEIPTNVIKNNPVNIPELDKAITTITKKSKSTKTSNNEVNNED